MYIMQKSNIMNQWRRWGHHLVSCYVSSRTRPRYAWAGNKKGHNLFNAFFLFAPAVSFAVLFTAFVATFVGAFPAILASAVPKGDG